MALLTFFSYWVLTIRSCLVCLQLNDKYHQFIVDSERERFISKLQEVEDWLYEDGEDETKGVYVAKLEELKKVVIPTVCFQLHIFPFILKGGYFDYFLQQGDPVEERYNEHTGRGSVIDQFVHCINSYREAAISNDPKFDHIDLAEKQKVRVCSVNFPILYDAPFPKGHTCMCVHDYYHKCGSVDTLLLQVLNECINAEAWLREKIQQQDTLPKYATPVLLSADIRKKAEALDRYFPTVL